MKVLVVYGSNDKKLRVRGRVKWMFFLSDCKHIHKGIIPEIHQIFQPMR